MKDEQARKVEGYEVDAPDHGGEVPRTFEKEER